MRDFPLLLLTATVWTYWITVGVMIVRVRRTTHRSAGLVPEESRERVMWIVWVPLVMLWLALPLRALRLADGAALPEFATAPAYSALRWTAAIVGALCLAATMKCWATMGKRWRMAVSASEPVELITDGLFLRIRHPIYAFSMLLMISSVAILPTWPLLAIAVVHIVLMNLKARNEERHLRGRLGDAYERYSAATGRFFPRVRQPTAERSS